MGRFRRWLPALACFLLSASLALLLPYPEGRYQHPDEDAHFLYVKWVAEGRGLPVFGERTPTYEAHQPPLYYVLCSPLVRLLGRAPDSTKAKACRLVSALLGGLTVYASLELFSRYGANFGMATALLLSGIPQFVYVSSGVGNDALANFVAVLCFLALLACLCRPQEVRAHLLLGLALGVAFVTKGVLALLLPAVALGFALGPKRGIWRRAGWVALAFLPLALPWLLRNLALYGDPLATKAFVKFFSGKRPGPDYFLGRGFSFGTYLLLVALLTAQSSFGYFGSMNLPLPKFSYAFALMIFLVGVSGLTVRRRRLQFDAALRATLLAYVAFFALLLASFLRFNLHFFQAQGRYLFPALPLICFAVGGGWLKLVGERGVWILWATMMAHQIWCFAVALPW